MKKLAPARASAHSHARSHALTRVLALILLSLSIMLVVVACGKPFNQLDMPEQGEEITILTTNHGVMKIKFFEDKAPETVKNFKELAKAGKYEDTIFHRVIKDFMIQGGDFEKRDGTGGYSYKGPGTYLELEIAPELKHIRGAVSMARKNTPLNSAGSQFFIVHPETGVDFLDGNYAVFGQVFEGLEVIDSITNLETDPLDKPLQDVVIEKVEFIEFESSAE